MMESKSLGWLLDELATLLQSQRRRRGFNGPSMVASSHTIHVPSVAEQ